MMPRCPALAMLLVAAAFPLLVEGGAAEIAEVRTLEELRQAEAHRLANGWEVRLGLGEPGDEAGPSRLLYCMAKYVGEGEPRIAFKGAFRGRLLGPVFFTLAEDEHARGQMAMQATAPAEALYGAVLATAWRGNYVVRVRGQEGKVVCRRLIKVVDERPCYWAQFATGRRRLVRKGAAPWVVRRRVAAAMPTFPQAAPLVLLRDGQIALHGGPRGGMPLPGRIPPGEPWASFLTNPEVWARKKGEPAHPLQLTLEDDAFVVRSWFRLVTWPDLRLLARWWVEGKPVVPPRTDRIEATSLGRAIAYGRVMKVAFALPDYLGELGVGDRVGLQVLYSPGMVRQLPRTRPAGELLRAVEPAHAAAANVPLLSNRLDLVLTRDLLEWQKRRAREVETDF